jgi:hypothetical protein
MNQYILKYKGDNEKEHAADVAMVKNTKELKILDESSPNMMLVQMSDKAKQWLETKLAKWSLFPQTMISKPDTKQKLKGKAYK